jgi:5-hydroxyisourate hydrolase
MSSGRRFSISTHVLDTEIGEPARGVPVSLERREADHFVEVAVGETDADGRIQELLPSALLAGEYRVTFDVAAYLERQGREVAFIGRVAIEFRVQSTERHYHVPLLVSRYSCSSYRGS